MSKNKEVTVKEEAQLPAEYSAEAWGNEFKAGKDFLISKILPMQGLSKLVADGKAMMGEFRDSVSGNLIGKAEEGIEVTPFHLEKVWDISEQQPDGQFKYQKTIPLVEDPTKPDYNDNLQWEELVNGVKLRRYRRLNYYVLLPKEVEAGTALPYVLSFKSTSLKAGKKLFTQMYVRNRMEKLPPPGYRVKVTGQKTKNEKGIFVVLDCEQGPRTTNQEVKLALEWFQMIKKGATKVDDSDIAGEVSEMQEGADIGTGEF